MPEFDRDHQRIADFYDQHYYGNAKVIPRDRHLENLAGRLRIQPGQYILDIACGTGSWLEAVSARGGLPSGIDISAKAIGLCRERMPGGTFHCGVAESLPFDSAKFDLVSCLGSLEHFLDQDAALREMVRVLKPGGRVLILVPNSDFPPYRLGIYRGTHQQVARETLRSLREWTAMFERVGLLVTSRWRDLHVLNSSWIMRPPAWLVPLRALQAAMLPLWPLRWQYQVYFLCRPRVSSE